MRGLGSVIDVSVIEARNAAIRLRAGIIDGAELPLRRSRIAQRAAAHTWQDAFDRLTARKVGTVRESTARAADSVWRKHMQPTLGAADVAATSREDVINLIANIGGSSARKVRNLAREIGSLAVSLGWTATNPAGAEIDVALPTAAKRTGTGHYRAMPHAMIGEWLRSLPAGPVANAIRVLVLTGARLSDVLGAEWAEIDGKVLTVAGARHKTDLDFRIPLTQRVLETIDAQRGQNARYVFPSLRTAGRPLSDETVRKAMPGEYDLHGFRAAFSTWAAETGQDSRRHRNGAVSQCRLGCGARIPAVRPVRPAPRADGGVGSLLHGLNRPAPGSPKPASRPAAAGGFALYRPRFTDH